MTVDAKRLLELLSIAEAGSFTKAAAARRVSQPALSNSMARLEKTLGVRILDRGRGGAALTDYGRLLVGHAQALAALLARAADDVQLKKQGLEGRLSVGASPLACVELVPNAVAQLLRNSPNIQVEIYERPDDRLMAGLRSGEFDVVVSPAGAQSDPSDVVRDVLMHDVAIVAMRKRHPLARRKTLSLKDLSRAHWVFPNPQTAMWRHIEVLFAAEHVPWPANYVTTNSMLALRAIVMTTDSVTLSSPNLLKLELGGGQLVGIALRKTRFVREIVVRWRRNQVLSPLAQRFVAALQAQSNISRDRA